jgi:hypothetical protein
MTPEWWKKIKLDNGMYSSNVKACPSFPDYFSQGYIMPMWVDSIIRFDSTNDTWSWETADNKFSWEMHKQEQFINHVKADFFGDIIKAVFKASCPWRIITPKGWSVYQIPLFFHYENEFTILPGVIDTDIYTQINQQVAFTSKSIEVFIKRGDPFAQYIPFKREKLGLVVRDADSIEAAKLKANDLKISGLFTGRGSYKKLQKNRDSCPITGLR